MERKEPVKCPKCNGEMVNEAIEWKCPKCNHVECIEPKYCPSK